MRYAVADADGHTKCDSHGYAKRDAVSYAKRDAVSYAKRDAKCNTERDAKCNTERDPDAFSYAQCNANWMCLGARVLEESSRGMASD